MRKKILLIFISCTLIFMSGCSCSRIIDDDKVLKTLSVNEIQIKHFPVTEIEDYEKYIFVIDFDVNKRISSNYNTLNLDMNIQAENLELLKISAQYHPYNFSKLDDFKIGIMFSSEEFSDEIMDNLSKYIDADIEYSLENKLTYKVAPKIYKNVKLSDIEFKNIDIGKYIYIDLDKHSTQSLMMVNGNLTFMKHQGDYLVSDIFDFGVDKIYSAYIFAYEVPEIIE